MDILYGRKGAHFTYRGRACVYAGVTPTGRYMFPSGDGWMLEVPDPETGLPVWPTLDQTRDLMASMDLIPRSNPLDDPVRQRARQEERTRETLVKAAPKARPSASRDPWFTLREMVLKKWDDDEIEECSLTNRGVKEWLEAHLDVEEIIRKYGRLPSCTTFRTWVNTRGLPRDRRPADFASQSGLGKRRRRIDPIVLAIIKEWALRYHSKPRQHVNTYFHKAGDDVQRYIEGKPLELYNFEEALAKPQHKVKMCTRRIFAMEVESAKSAKGFGLAYGQRAREQRFGGGGVAQEPTRYLEIVQLDDTPFPMVFVIDPVRRVPVGVPTVTIALCIYTRVIVGWDISYDTPSHATYMRTLLSTALPKAVPPRFAHHPELSELCGKVVGHMLLDNAKHQIARAAQDAGGDIGQGVRWAGKKQPTHKGHVESCLNTLQELIREELPAGTWDIPLMREFDYDPAKHAIVTLEKFREIFAAAVAKYHTSNHTGLIDRWPLEVWLEQREQHGLDWVHDPDYFQRAVGNVSYVSFRGDGACIKDLKYGSDGTDDRYPLSNEEILHHLALARGASSDTKKQTFENVKIKWDPNDLSKAWLFDEHLREYVAIPCTRRRYAENLPLWLHERVKEFATKKRLKFDDETGMLNAREAFSRTVSDVLPEASHADRRAAARLRDSREGQTYLGDTAQLIRIIPSPSGMETKIAHDLRVGTRGDATRVAPRSSNRAGKKPRRDRRDAPRKRPEPEIESPPEQEDAAYVARRLDGGWSDGGYR